MAMITEELVSHFEKPVRQSDGSYMCKCPAHDDKKQSLHITPGSGKTLIKCFAGCTVENILAAKGLSFTDLYYPGTDSTDPGRRDWRSWLSDKVQKEGYHLIATYDYQSIDSGEYSFTKIRLEPKDFRYGIVSEGRISFGLKNTDGKKTSRKKLPAAAYGSIDKIRSTENTERKIFYCEGEKDVETLQEMGFLAFTAGAAEDWEERIAPLTKDRDLIILSDNDSAGFNLSAAVMESCQKLAKSVKIIIPVKDEEKADVSDFFGKHHKTVSQFKQMISDEDDTAQVMDAVKNAVTTDTETAEPLQMERLKRDENGKVKEEIANYCFVLEHDPKLSGVIKFNELTREIYVHGDLPWKLEDESNSRAWKNSDYSNLLLYLEQKHHLSSEKKTDHALTIVSHKNHFNPLKDLLNSLEWDGVPRIKTLLSDYLGAETDKYSEEVMKLIMMGAINRAMQPGCKFDNTVILVGEQGKFKSTFVQLLAMDDDWYSEAPPTFDSVDAMRVVRGKWIVELGELSTIRKTSDMEAVKKFLTARSDRFTDKYIKYPEDNPRTCIFIGTTNNRSFLTDKTGNRRFIPITVNLHAPSKSLFDKSAAEHIRQAWAEAMEIYRSGEYSLVPEGEFLETIEQNRESAVEEDPLQSQIEMYLEGKNRVAATEIVKELLNPDQREMNKWSRVVNEILSNMPGWKREAKRQRNPKYGLCQHYYRDSQETDDFVDAEPSITEIFQ